MKKVLSLFVVLFLGATAVVSAQDEAKTKPEHLTVKTFKEKVYNYETNSGTWKFEGDRPCIVDFYADWCKPCKMIAPYLEELAEEYKGQIDVYKINTEQQRELSRVFGVKSIPTVLFVPMKGQPQVSKGAMPKANFKKAIDEFLLGKKADQ